MNMDLEQGILQASYQWQNNTGQSLNNRVLLPLNVLMTVWVPRSHMPSTADNTLVTGTANESRALQPTLADVEDASIKEESLSKKNQIKINIFTYSSYF
jgi:hypothetical protein